MFPTFSLHRVSPGAPVTHRGNRAQTRKRLARYVVIFTLALFADFLTLRSAKDRGSDVGRPLPSVRGNPERPEA